MSMLRNKRTNYVLPSKVVDSGQIDKAMSGYSGFWGCMNAPEFINIYPEMHANDSVIINLDSDWTIGPNGTHWTMCKISTDGLYILYSDSFGTPPPKEFYKISDREVLYSTKITQKSDKENCGKLAVEKLKKIIDAGIDDVDLFYALEEI